MKLKQSVKKALVKGTLMVGAAYITASLIASSLVGENEIIMKEVEVQEGDTMWSLVKAENKHYSGDLRNLTNYIELKNTIYPGQTIEIPVYNKK